MMDRVEKIVDCLRRYEPERIILFGSYARGEADEHSDLDVVVIKQTEQRFLERLIEVARYLDNNLGKVDVFVYTWEELEGMKRSGNPFIEQVLTEGIVLYEAP